jgi:hypothetical protein
VIGRKEGPSSTEASAALSEAVNTILATSDDQLALHLADPLARANCRDTVELLDQHATALRAAAAEMESATNKLTRALAAAGEALA